MLDRDTPCHAITCHPSYPSTLLLLLLLQAVSADKGKDAKMDWEAIHGLMEDAIYGGRIDNAYDLRVLRAYLR